MKIKRNAKAVLAVLLSAMVCVCLASGEQGDYSYADDTSDYEQQLSEIAEKQEELADKISELQDNIAEQEEYQQLIESQIETTSQKIELIDGHLTTLSEEMDEISQSISETTEKLEAQKSDIEDGISSFKLRLRALYLAGSSTYTSVILGSDDFFDMLMKIELVERVAAHDDELIDSLVAQKDDYEQTVEELNSQKAELEEKQADYEEQKSSMTDEIQNLSELYESVSEELEDLEAEKSKYVDQKSEYDAEQDSFEQQLQAAIKAQSEKVAATTTTTTEATTTTTTTEPTTTTTTTTTTASTGTTNEKTTTTTTTTKKTTTTTQKTTTTTTQSTSGFKWPCPGYYLITSSFGSRWGSFHYGMDIGNSGIRGASVVAAKSGTVIMTNNSCTHDYGKSESCGCGWGWGNYCVIDHGDGYQTIYAHMSECVVSVGQTVTQGQLLGYVGSTGWSTGPHLHFEIRIDGTAVDPMKYF